MSDTQQVDQAIRHELREFVEENFLSLHPHLELSDADKLLQLGIVDSLGFVELVEEIQERFAVDVRDVEITEDNFGSIDAMVAFVERKRGG
jgi:acyl carrier protein